MSLNRNIYASDSNYHISGNYASAFRNPGPAYNPNFLGGEQYPRESYGLPISNTVYSTSRYGQIGKSQMSQLPKIEESINKQGIFNPGIVESNINTNYSMPGQSQNNMSGSMQHLTETQTTPDMNYVNSQQSFLPPMTGPSIMDKNDPTKLYRQESSNWDYEALAKEAAELRDVDKAEDLLKKNLFFEEKEIGTMQLYCHLAGTCEILLMIIGTIGGLAAGWAMPYMAYLSSDMMSDIGNTSEVTTPEQVAHMLEVVNDVMWTQIKRFLIFGGAMFVANFCSTGCWYLCGNKMVYMLKKRYFEAILRQEQAWFDAHNAYEFATKVQAQMEQVEMGLGEKLGMVIQSTAQFITGIIIAFITSWKLSLVILCAAPFILATCGVLVTCMKTGIIMGRKTYEKAGGLAEEVLYNVKTVASFSNFEYEHHRFGEKCELCHQLDLGTTIRLGTCIGFLIFFLNCTFVIGFIYGRTLIKNGYNGSKGRFFRAGDVMCCCFSLLMAVMGIGLVAPNFKLIQEANTATSDYFTLIERKVEFDFSESVQKPPRETVQGLIELRNVSFVYPSDPNKRKILHNLNLRFEPGKKVALVGESGCGKSTTVNLIERLYETTDGEVLIDGMNIKKWDLHYLRTLIGYVQQEPVLFNSPIRDNIIFGRDDVLAELGGNTDELIEAACRESYADEFIENLPGRLQYVVGIKGSKLSGGQKQRVAIARAILCQPKILILDEATSALDNKSEKEVQRALDNISNKSVTTVIIAHRLSTIKNADLIYAIKEGHLIEQGTHEELLAKNGYYAGLVRSQLAQDEIETKNELEMKRKKTSMKVANTDEEVQFENQEDIIYTKQDSVKVNPCRLFGELGDRSYHLFWAIVGAVLMGVSMPFNGFLNAKTMNSLNSRYRKTRMDDGLKYALIFLGLSVIQGIGTGLMIYNFFTVGLTLAKIFRKKIYKKYLELHISFYDITANAPGALLTRMSIDTMQLNSLVMSTLGTTTQCAVCLITLLIIGCIYDYRLCLVAICFIPLVTMAIITRRQLNRGSSKQGVKANVEAGAILSECCTNTKTIYSFNFQRRAVELYLEKLQWVYDQFTKDAFWAGFFIGIGTFAMFCSNATVFALTKHYINTGSIDSETMGIAMSVTMTGTAGISSGMNALGDIKKATVAFKSLYSVLDTESLIKPYYKQNEGKVSALNIKGKIEFRHVYFAYPTRPENIILKDVSFTILPGQQCALVGYSGSGKSTIIQLLERFYDVDDDKGQILIDDIPIKEYNLYELRKKIGLVSQEPSLFKRSVLENVRYGNLQATDEECIEAARQANIMKFFQGDAMHKVLDDEATGKKKKTTKQGDDKSGVGKKEDPVSGGEKQRLCIARAFLKNPTILLLDEATSALDKDSEIEVQKSLDRLAGGRTSVAIAHRLSTIEHCDQIFVLENGRLVEQGNHEELMAKQAKYYILHKYSDAA